jgi:hypothetical protein
MRVIIRGMGGGVCKRSALNGGVPEEAKPKTIAINSIEIRLLHEKLKN